MSAALFPRGTCDVSDFYKRFGFQFSFIGGCGKYLGAIQLGNMVDDFHPFNTLFIPRFSLEGLILDVESHCRKPNI